MKIVFLDGEKIDSVAEMHAVFAAELDFPAYYGGNLDALHDLLTENAGKIGVIVANPEAFKKTLGRRFKPFVRLMEELTSEREGFYFTLEPFGKPVE